jgi:hypothetical protein
MLWYKGTLKAQHPSVQLYAVELAHLLRKQSDFKLYYTCKMLYWFNLNSVPMYPMILTQYGTQITCAHPGQTRFLAAYLMGVHWPARVCTHAGSTDVLIKPKSCTAYKADHTLKNYGLKVRTEYMHTAQLLELEFAHCDAWEFYTSVYDWVVAKRG